MNIVLLLGIRDESFITRWGPGYIQRGLETFLVKYGGWGSKIKGHWGREVIYSIRYVFHWFWLSLKVMASVGGGGGGAKPRRPSTSISQLILSAI